MGMTFRCVCGHINPLPQSPIEAAARTCPGCRRSLAYLYDEAQNESRIMNELRESRKRRYIPLIFTPIAWIAIWSAIIAQRPQSVQVVGRDDTWSLGWLIGWALCVLFLALPPWLMTVNVLLLLRTGKDYVQDRVAFAEAGCYDIVNWAPITGFLLTYALYWWTLHQEADPISWIRGPAPFVGVYFLTEQLCVVVAAFVFFHRRD
jgi:hypothetical protein